MHPIKVGVQLRSHPRVGEGDAVALEPLLFLGQRLGAGDVDVGDTLHIQNEGRHRVWGVSNGLTDRRRERGGVAEEDGCGKTHRDHPGNRLAGPVVGGGQRHVWIVRT